MRAFLAASVTLMFIGAAVAHSPGPAVGGIPAGASDLQAYIDVTTEMHERWWALDQACDPDAVFALLYLITTAKVGDLVQAGHFKDNPFLVAWDADFAQRYFDAYDIYHDGSSAADAWVDAFDTAAGGQSTVTEDMLLGMNAHVNYDLSHSTAFMRLPQDRRQDDYDRVNDAFAGVVGPASHQIGMRYDAGLARDENDTSPLDDIIVTTLISWRDNAWANAALLAAAEGDPIATAAAEAKIDSEAAAIAAPLMVPHGDTASDRIAYCQASGHPALPPELGGPGYGSDWIRGPDDGAEFAICHKPGTPAEKTLLVDEHAWGGHAKHGDVAGAC